MSRLKNFLAGLVVSFIGSIPFGYLNILATKVFIENGKVPFLALVFGIVVVEAIAIIIALRFARWLVEKKQLVKGLEIFTIFFLLVLAAASFLQPQSSIDNSKLIVEDKTLIQFFLTGLLLSSLNFLQFPFWAGWNIYLLENGTIKNGKTENILFVSGAVSGTIMAMSVFAITITQAGFLAKSIVPSGKNYLLTIVFVILALVQLVKVIRKYRVVN